MRIKDYVSGRDICDIRGVHREAVYSWKIPYILIGNTRFYKKEDVLSLREGKSKVSFKEAIDKAFNYEGMLPTSELCSLLGQIPANFQERYTRGGIHMTRIKRHGTYWYVIPTEVVAWLAEGYTVMLLSKKSDKEGFTSIRCDQKGNEYGLYL